MPKRKPKILLWDIEVSHMVAATFSLFRPFIPQENIMQEQFIFSIAYKWLGDKKTKCISLLDFPQAFKKDHTNDYHVVKAFREVLMEADIIVHHNGDHFDLKKFNTALLRHGLDPLPYIPSVDTYKVAKRHFNLPSKKLNYLATMLGIGSKIDTDNKLWLKCLAGDKKSLKEMVRYNKGDIHPTLEGVYLKLRPFMDRHPNIALITETDERVCPVCGSNHVQKRGSYKTRVSKFVRYQCMDCKSWSRSKEKEYGSDLR